jgi:hypothetical protein
MLTLRGAQPTRTNLAPDDSVFSEQDFLHERGSSIALIEVDAQAQAASGPKPLGPSTHMAVADARWHRRSVPTSVAREMSGS